MVMDNVCLKLKKVADLICERVEADGVYYTFKRLQLIYNYGEEK